MISCSFRVAKEDGQEAEVAQVPMPHAPREGEHVWLVVEGQKRMRRHRVLFVTYWAFSPEPGAPTAPCCGAEVLVQPVENHDDARDA